MDKIKKKILLILPHDNFDDQEYEEIKNELESNNIETETASTHLSEAQGINKSIVVPDVLISFVEAGDYDGFIFIGEKAATEYFSHPTILRIIDQAHFSHKTIAAIGASVPAIAYTGKLGGQRVTGTEDEHKRLEELGAIFTGRRVEVSDHFITASGPESTTEFVRAIVDVLNWSPMVSERKYLR